ncbi:iron ABC transporter permease [Rhizobiaceae bacterium BDR2-2]|uniref:Iron ABC transporter permease n=1 Tax=Ectorhizobium quercum TaxID=2965071 RepID=A0AAE3N3S0_9HYPH|nr:iron ABC transporter permease [Ectorhizobium quercum]MCX8999417.1 iron ABC transporter permease [Ectorhizobium quercum]
MRSTGLQWAVMLVLAVLVLTPLLPILVQAFASAPLYDSSWQFTFGNFQAFIRSPQVWAATGNTLVFTLISTGIALVAGAAMAILVGRTDLPLRGFVGDLFMVPLYLSHLILCIGWMTMYAPGGFVTTWLLQIGVPQWNLYSMGGMSLVAGVAQAPLVYMYCLYGAAGGAGGSLEDAARTVGAGRFRVLFSITLPLMVPALVYATILNLVAGLEMLAIPKLLGKTSNIHVLSTFLFDVGIDNPNPNHGLVANAAFLLMALVGISLFLQWRLLRNAFKFTTVQGKAGRAKRVSLGKWRWVLFALIMLYMLVTLVIPVGGIILRAFTVILTPLVPLANVLTTANVVRMFEEPRFFQAIVNTIEVGLLSAAIGTVLCAVLVLVSQRSSFRHAALVDGLAMLPRVLPGLIVGLGVFYAAVIFPPFGWIRSSIWILVVAYLMNMIPLGVGVIAPAVLQISRDLDKAGRVSGADWLRTSLSIITPLLKPAMAGTFILMFVASLKSYTIAMFLFSPRTEVIGASILLLAGDGDTGIACALATVQIAFTLIIVLVARWLMGVRIYG